MNPIVTAANHAAQQTDRWLFVAVLIIVGLGIVWLGRYFINQNEKLVNSQMSTLREITAQQVAATEHMGAIVAHNSEALQENARELAALRQHCELLQRVRHPQ